VFDFPEINASIDYLFLKLVGRCNSSDTWNYFSEFKIYGTYSQNSVFSKTDGSNVTIYPNPASEYLNIYIEEATLVPDLVRINDLSGKTVYETSFIPGIINFPLPQSLQKGIYIVKLLTDGVILFAQKLIINR